VDRHARHGIPTQLLNNNLVSLIDITEDIFHEMSATDPLAFIRSFFMNQTTTIRINWPVLEFLYEDTRSFRWTLALLAPARLSSTIADSCVPANTLRALPETEFDELAQQLVEETSGSP